MKTRNRTIKALLSGIAFLCSFSAWCVTEINVSKAGTLATLMQDMTFDRELKLSGFINGTDVKYLRELITTNKVVRLNLQDVQIVKGGVAYNENYTTQDNVLGDYMFADCSKLTTCVLPSNITSIGRYAFSHTAIKEVNIPNTVTLLGGACFADCSSLTSVVIGSKVSK